MSTTRLNIGQMLLAGFDGTAVGDDHWVVGAIREQQLGGVILFDRNVDGSRQNIISPEQLTELTATLQDYAEIPLFIAVDQEGGRVCRLKEQDGFAPTVSAGLISRKNDVEASRRHAEQMAEMQSACGITLNLAPVVDLDLNPDNPIISRYERSYGRTTDSVFQQASIFIKAHHANGIACCLKHFPGHGSAAADSHLGFVDITGYWTEEELEPYRRLLAEGFGDAVMSAHVVNRQFDPDGLPATLSGKTINGLLRRKLGFDGVVLSDDLQMKAISDRWSYEEAVQMAVLAGIDIVIVGNNLVRERDVVGRGIRAIEELVQSRRLGIDSLQASLARIDALKKKIKGELPWRQNQPTT